MYPNGSSTGQTKSNLTGSIAPGAVHVVCEAQSGIPSDQNFTAGPNGNDAIALEKNGGILVDLVGNIGCDPGSSWNGNGLSTKDMTLVRRPCVTQGINSDPGSCSFPTLASEWIGFPTDDLTNLGSHDEGINILDVEASDPTDCLVKDGFISISASGPALEYSIDAAENWSSSPVFENLGGGIYLIEVRSDGSSSCLTSDQAELVERKSPTLIEIHTENVTDCGISDGSIDVIAEGDAIEYSIDGGNNWQNGSTFNDLAVDIYDIQVRSVGTQNCLIMDVAIISGPEMPKISSLEVEQISDCGASDGEVVVDATGQNLEYSIDNNNWTSSNYFVGLDPGDYDVTVRVENTELCFDQFSFSLAGPEIPIVSNVRATDQTDCEVLDGSIHVEALGVQLEYRLDDGPWETSSLFPILGAGNYAIQIREQDHHGCLASTEIAIDGPALPAIVDIVARGPSDCGAEDGYIEIDAAGNQLEYSIDGGETWQSTNEFGDLKDGSYTAQIREANTSQCLVTTNIELQGPLLPVINGIDLIDPSDCGISDGSIEISASGNALEFTIGDTWSSNPIFPDLNAGTYLVRVRKANTQFCIDTVIVTLDSPLAPTIDDISITDPTQCGLDDGTILITASGTDLEYSINDGSSWSDNHKFDGLGGGSLNVIVREASSPFCLSETKIYLEKLDAPVLRKIEAMNPDDCTNENGSILIEAEGGNLEYSISNGENWTDNPKFIQLSGGNYQVIIRSHRLQSCEIKEEVALTSPENPVIEHIEPYHPDNCGAENGWLAIEATGINLEYSIDGFSWQSGKVFTNLGPGIYNPQVRIKETINCLVSSEVTLQTPLAPKIRDLETHDPSGCTVANGRILVHADGDDLEYSIDNGSSWQQSKIFTNLAGGVYSIIVREKNQEGCIATANTQLSQPIMPRIDEIEITHDTDCQSPNGSIEIIAEGTDLEYALHGQMPWQEEPQFTGLAGGNYQVQVREGKAEDCMVSHNTSISSPSIPEIEIKNPSDCGVSDGQVSIDVKEETALFSIDSLHWQSESVFENLAADTYPIFVLIENCVSRSSARLAAPEMPQISEIRHESPGCELADGSMSILASGDDLEFSIDGGETFSADHHFTNLASATYEIEVRSANASQCRVQTIYYLPESLPVVTSVAYDQPSCHAGEDGKASINIAGGTAPYRITWKHGTQLVEEDSFSLSNLTAGRYHLEIIDDANCHHLDTLTIPSTKEIVVSTSYTIVDKGFYFSVQILGGVPPYDIQWTSGQTDSTVFVAEPGLYGVTVVDANGCMASDSILAESALCNIDWSAEVIHNQCYGDSLGSISILMTTPPDNPIYRWETHPGQNISALSKLPAGTYNVTIEAGAGCTTSGMIEIKQPDSLQLDIATGNESSVDAQDGWIDVDVRGGQDPYQIHWNTGETSQTLVDLTPGWYILEITDAAGCDISDSIEILSAPECTIDVIAEVIQPNCHQEGAIFLDLNAPDQDEIVLSWLDSSNLAVWSRPSLQEGTYYYRIESGQCEIIDSIVLKRQEISAINYSLMPPNLCQLNSSITLNEIIGGIGPYQINIDSKDVKPNQIVELAGKDSVAITVTDGIGCVYNQTVPNVQEDFGISLPADTFIHRGENVTLEVGTDEESDYQISWSNSNDLLCAPCTSIEVQPLLTQTYTFSIRDLSGCLFQEDITVYVDGRNLIYIPNAITLNGDDINDEWIIYDGRDIVREIKSLQIFDRRGSTIMEIFDLSPNEPIPHLKTTLSNVIAPSVLMYRVIVQFKAGFQQTYIGGLNILR